jgi:hypothetical protein
MLIPALGGVLLTAALAAGPAKAPAAPEAVIESVAEASSDTAKPLPSSPPPIAREHPGEDDAAAAPSPGRLGPARKSIKLVVYGPGGKILKLADFLSFIGRADRSDAAGPEFSGIFVAPFDGSGSASRPALEQRGELIVLSWEKMPRVSLSLPWPVADDGFSTVWADKNGEGFSDGDAVFLNEEIAITQYRRFRESLRKRTSDWTPLYKPGAKARKAADVAQSQMTRAHAEKDAVARAQAFDAALTAVSAAWQKMLFEHGLQIALAAKSKGSLRFGLVIDESIFQRLDHYERIISAVKRTGSNWVRLVFRSNPDDFTYKSLRSFNEYDSIVAELLSQKLHIMGTVLDTGQWPRTMTPPIYAERTKNLVLHYKEQIRSWEVGNELNGDWLGGVKAPLDPDQVYRIYSAGAAKVKELDPSLETVATLYWWDGTAPDSEHSLFGWLKRYSRRGFGRNLDVLSLSLQPDDNPVGMAFENIFDRVSNEMPDKSLMLGSLGYVEKDKLQGYWWLRPDDVPAAREDLLIFAATASCAMPRSLCGGFWWQTLEQMIPDKGRATGLYHAYAKTLEQLGR